MTETYAIAMVQGLVLWVVDGQTPVDELERLRAMVRTHPRADRPSVTLIVIHGTRSTMNAEERRSVLAMIDETKHHRLASATVIGARGMLGALHRSILTGFSLLLPPPHPHKVFGDVPEAIAYLMPWVPKVSDGLDATAIEAMLADLYAQLLARKPDAG